MAFLPTLDEAYESQTLVPLSWPKVPSVLKKALWCLMTPPLNNKGLADPRGRPATSSALFFKAALLTQGQKPGVHFPGCSRSSSLLFSPRSKDKISRSISASERVNLGLPSWALRIVRHSERLLPLLGFRMVAISCRPPAPLGRNS